MTEESAVKVCVRVRPLIAREENAALDDAQPVKPFWRADQKSIHQIDDGNSTKSFSFDRVFTDQETTNQLYQNIAKALVVSSVEGYNGTIFAYGQTASGKTFTMMGSEHIPGVIPLAVEDVFQTIKTFPKKEFLLRVSYMEIYNETVSDLLVESWKRKPLEVRETTNKNTYVADLTEELVTSSAQALAWIRKGEKNRRYGMTKMNQRSSRSHTIFRMILESRERSDPLSGENGDGAIIVSHLNLVDLAGSERASQTGAEGTRFKEGCNINRSLFTLGQVIKKVTDESQKGFTNYRDSKLTRILQNSLGGNAKTVIICTITPVALDETLSTLQFASTAKKMKNDPHVTEVSDDGALLKRYRNEIEELKRRLTEVSSVTQTTVTEKKVLAQLLQEKDQLQRDQEDRIRNLTRLLVTSSNLVPYKKMPKRRVTWGGKMLRLAHLSIPEASEHSFSEHSAEKWKDVSSCLMELPEDDVTIDHWNETSEEMDQSSIQSFEHGCHEENMSPERITELLQKVSNLELQLENESQQKEEAVDKLSNLDVRVSELQLQLQTEIQQKNEALEKVLNLEKRSAELELLQQTEAQLKSEAKEIIDMLNLKVADQETQLEEHSHCRNENKQMRRDFEDTIQLCEALALEKNLVTSERDILREELRTVMERTEHLEMEKSALSQVLQDKKEIEEFESLEDEIRKEHENEIKNEILTLKKALESSEVEQQMLQSQVRMLADELNKARGISDSLQKKMEHLNEDLQHVSDEREVLLSEHDLGSLSPRNKDQMQSLITLLTAEKDQLQSTLESVTAEKDQLQTTLTTVTAENDQMQCTLTFVTAEKDQLQFSLNSLTAEKDQLQSVLASMTAQNIQLQSTITIGTTDNNKLHSIITSGTAENDQLQSTLASLTAENIQLQSTFTSVTAEKDQLQSTITSATVEEDQLQSTITSLSTENNQLKSRLTSVSAEKDQLQSTCTSLTAGKDDLQSMLTFVTAEKDQLQSTLRSVTAEKDQLQSTMTSVTAGKDQLQSMLASLTTEKDQLQSTMTSVTAENNQLQSMLASLTTEKDQLQSTMTSVTAENNQLQSMLSSVTAEHDRLQSLITSVTAENDELQCMLTSLPAEKDQLQSTLTFVTAENDQLQSMLTSLAAEKDQLQSRRTSLTAEDQLQSTLRSVTAEKDELQSTITSVAAEKDQLQSVLISLTAEKDKLQSIITAVTAENDQLQSMLTSLTAEKDQLQSKITSATAEKDQLQSTLTFMIAKKDQLQFTHTSVTAENDQLQSTLISVTAENDQLQSTLTSVTAEKDQLQSMLSLVTAEKDQLQSMLSFVTAEKDQLQSMLTFMTAEKNQLQSTITSATAENDQLQSTLTSLTAEKDKLKSTLTSVTAEKDQLESISMSLNADADYFKSDVLSLSGDIENLKKKDQLPFASTCVTAGIDEMNSALTLVTVEGNDVDTITSVTVARDQLKSLLTSQTAESHQPQSIITSLTGETNQLQSTLAFVTSERDESGNLQQLMQIICEMVQGENESLQLPESLSNDVEKILSLVASVCAERDQLKMDVKDNVEMMIDNQEELRTALEKIRCQKEMIKQLKTAETLNEDLRAQLESLKRDNQTATEGLDAIRKERNHLLLEKAGESQLISSQLEELQNLSKDKEKLQQKLYALKLETKHLKAELGDRMEAFQGETSKIKDLLRALHEELQTQKRRNIDLQRVSKDMEISLDQQIKMLTCKVERIADGKNALLSQEKEKCQSVTVERDSLQEELDILGVEKQQLKDTIKNLQKEVDTVKEKLQDTEMEKKDLLSKQEASHTASVDNEMLQLELITVTGERDQLQLTLDALREENKRLSAELLEKLDAIQSALGELNTVRDERDHLLSERASLMSSKLEELQTLGKEKEKLQEKMHTLRQKTKELKAELEDRMETFNVETSKIQDLLKGLHEELHAQKQRNSDLQKVSKDMESSLDQKIKVLTCKVEKIVEEKDALLSEEKKNLESVIVDRDSLQGKLHILGVEKQQLVVELQDKMETLQREVENLNKKLQITETEKDLLSKQEASHTASSGDEMLQLTVTTLTGERDQLQLTLDALREENKRLSAELMEKIDAITAIEENRQQQNEVEQELVLQKELPGKASDAGLAFKEQLRLDQITTVRQTSYSWLHSSTEQLEESFGRLQLFIDTCSKCISAPVMQNSLKQPVVLSLSEYTRDAYTSICQFGSQTFETLGNIFVCLQRQAQDYKKLFEELVNTDLAVFEERMLQKVLLCRLQTDISVGEEDFHIFGRERQNELLVKRQLYQKKITRISENLWSSITSNRTELSEEITQRENFIQQLRPILNRKPIDVNALEGILKIELDRRFATANSKQKTLQAISDTQNCVKEEIKQLAQTYLELKQERSRSCAVMQALNKVPVQTEVSLQEKNHDLQQTEENLQAKNTPQTQKNKQHDAEKSSANADELKTLHAKVVKMEAKLSSEADKHQHEIHRLNTLLKDKEESLRKLKEMLRLQQGDEELVPQGEALYNKLTNPKGLVIKRSVLLDKAKLEEEVKRLQAILSEKESLVGSLQAEISKWKKRAIKLKGKSVSPCTPTKREHVETFDSPCKPPSSKRPIVTPSKNLNSPRKVLESPNRALEINNTCLPELPKSKFFDTDNSASLLSTTYPKQFFDNSGLGTITDLGAPSKENSPPSPKYDEMCRTQ